MWHLLLVLVVWRVVAAVAYRADCCTHIENGRLLWRQRWRPLQWRHNEHDGVSDHYPHDYLLNRLFSHRSKKTSKLRVTGLCAGNSPVTGKCFYLMTSSCKVGVFVTTILSATRDHIGGVRRFRSCRHEFEGINVFEGPLKTIHSLYFVCQCFKPERDFVLWRFRPGTSIQFGIHQTVEKHVSLATQAIWLLQG